MLKKQPAPPNLIPDELDCTPGALSAGHLVKANDLQARRISAAENLQREDLSAIETIEAIAEIVDAELIDDIEYLSMGERPTERVKALLAKLDSVRRSKELGYGVTTQARSTSHKFVGSVEKIFKSLPKPLEWRSFYNHGLPLLMDFCERFRKYRFNTT